MNREEAKSRVMARLERQVEKLQRALVDEDWDEEDWYMLQRKSKVLSDALHHVFNDQTWAMSQALELLREAGEPLGELEQVEARANSGTEKEAWKDARRYN